MDAATLRAAQAPLKERFKTDPSAALITLHARGVFDGDGITCRIERAGGPAIAGLHPATGGSGAELCSGDMLLEALVACAGVTLRSVATVMGIAFASGTVTAEGEVDFRGTLGVARDAPVGFVAIRLHFALATDAAPDMLDKLLRLTERYCVVSQSLNVKPAMTIAATAPA